MSRPNPIRVMVVDDHNMVRRGLVAYLEEEPDLELVGEAADGQEAVQLCEQLLPDVILMDLIMPELGGVDATRSIRKRWPQVQVIALTSFQDREMVQEALKEGAISYLLKNVTGEEVLKAVRSAYAGRPTIAPEVTQQFILDDKTMSPGDDLTEREREVLDLIAQGRNNEAIATLLSLSPKTVRNHVSNILSKRQVVDRAEAIVRARQAGLGQE